MQYDSDTKDISHPPVCGCPSSENIIAGAGRTLSDVADYTWLNRTMTDDPWRPFPSEHDFDLAR